MRSYAFGAIVAVTVNACAASAASAATTSKHVLPTLHPPTTKQHSEFVVETNKLGQVTRADKVTRSTDDRFNAITYGNTLQAYIRTPDGKAIPGLYRLSYDYDPVDKKVKRSVALLRMGGVNPNAPGAVIVEERKVQAERHQVQAASAEASALPDLHQMTRHHH